MFFSLIFSAYAQVSASNEIGTVNLDKDVISVSRHFDEYVKIYGSITDASRGTKISISITDPNGDIDPSSQQVFTTDVGYFETVKILNWESERGTYSVLVSSSDKIIGSLSFMVSESVEQPMIIQTPKQITHNTEIILNLEKASSSDSIRAFPKFTDDFGTELSFEINGTEKIIEIYVDDQYVKSVKANQPSEDIFVGYGNHDVYAKSPEFTVGNTDTYIPATSEIKNIYLQSLTVSGSVPANPTIVSSTFTDQSEVTITPASGSDAPGCQETPEGCFLPSIVTVDVGGVVIFSNTDSAAHTFTSGTPTGGPDGLFDSNLVMAGATFQWSPSKKGVVDYFCMIHPWMEGTIFVGQSPSIPSPTSKTPQKPNIPPVSTQYTTQMSLQVTKGSSADSIQVYPELTYDSGIILPDYTVGGTSDYIKIYVDNQYLTSVAANRQSDDIFVGYGYHNVYGEFMSFTDTTTGDEYTDATSATTNINLQSPITNSPVINPPTTNPSTNPPTNQDNSWIALIVILAIITIVIIAVKRKRNIGTSSKKQSTIQPQSSASMMSYYECPKCHSGNIQNNPDGSVNCPDCNFRV